ncbi:DUF2752 domain-containing protein [Peterkaempfera sp. SMS 1(5)a]|uniref:DUF2752 domain-containing protein n=1 Tax=Peterkaempfera podocarpi TaxID=3232308 RepID=UPI00366B131B
MNAPAAPAHRSAVRRLAAPLTALAAAAAPALFVAAVDPNTPGRYPVCPFLQATGWWCPGCGGLRCVHALTHGHPLQALHDNLLVVLLLTTAALLWLNWAASALASRPVRLPTLHLRHVLPAIAVVAAFTVARNLPLGAALAP